MPLVKFREFIFSWYSLYASNTSSFFILYNSFSVVITSLASLMISSPSSIDIIPSEINSSIPKINSILSIEILASNWPARINFLTLSGVKSVTLPKIASGVSSLSILHTLDILGFPKKRSLLVINLYSSILPIVLAFYLGSHLFR